jgi:hypothetical protein
MLLSSSTSGSIRKYRHKACIVGEDHAGVIFVDDASILGSDFGGLMKALSAEWHRHADEEWTNRIVFLKPI